MIQRDLENLRLAAKWVNDIEIGEITDRDNYCWDHLSFPNTSHDELNWLCDVFNSRPNRVSVWIYHSGGRLHHGRENNIRV